MKYKREIPRQKGFWIGIGACALVGLIAATIAYFSSSHMFENNFKSSFNHSIELYDLVDADKAMSMWPGETIDTHVVIKNTGDPVLARIKYFKSSVEKDSDGKTRKLTVDEVKYGPYLKLENTSNTDFTNPVFDDSNKFLFNDNDGMYYYQGVISNTEVKHLKQITFGKATEATGQLSYLNPSYTGSTPWEDDSNWSSSNTPGHGTMKEFSLNSQGALLGVYIETVEATNPRSGEGLTDDDVSSKTVSELKEYWTQLVPETAN